MKKSFILIFALTLFTTTFLQSQQVKFSHIKNKNSEIFVLENGKIKQSIVISNRMLLSDTLQSLESWTRQFHRPGNLLITDADFNIRIVYNDLRAPGKQNNAENPVTFTKKDFVFERYVLAESTGKERQADLYFKGTDNPFSLRISYKLNPGEFFIRRKITLSDPGDAGHLLDRMSPRAGRFIFKKDHTGNQMETSISIEGMNFAYSENIMQAEEKDQSFALIKEGGFGQPVVFANSDGSGFTGLEYPTGTSRTGKIINNLFEVESFQYFGQKISVQPISSAWDVTATAPQPYAKKWFFKYVDAIRVAPAKPYTLYNSWYDLRSPAFAQTGGNRKGIPEDAVMNEKNTLRIIGLLRKNMIEKYGIQLDAFVLDDGWDIYESPWKLRTDQFPHGLRPIADTLAKTGTRLGLWFGPMGGYSYALRRIKWMGEHGYEVTGHQYRYGSARLCLAGKNYGKMFLERTTGFTRHDKVGYYKWDGIQFACSEPGHGHPVGIYSRRAVMETIINNCNALRAIDPDVYLNITTGTWLSPWWLQYANQIWMDAADYAFADVPSLSRRDNAMTYRDYALFDDFKVRNLWFPVSNLMTHGIIKGRLENISKEGEPLDRFTNNAVLYFARGVSMWELYISPDNLTPSEWNALSQAIKWAKDKQEELATTFMTGGNPALGKTYGYVHLKGKTGVIAVRNPKVEDDVISVGLKPEYGLDEDAANLVVEQVYPQRKILPQLYSAGGTLEIMLDGFETAVFHIYPLNSTNRPLLADAIFSLETNQNKLSYKIYQTGPDVRFLQPEKIETMSVDGQKSDFKSLKGGRITHVKKDDFQVTTKKNKKNFAFVIKQNAGNQIHANEVALLLKDIPKNSGFPVVEITSGDKPLTVNKQSIPDKWAWFSATVPQNGKDITVTVNGKEYKGTAELWINGVVQQNPVKMEITVGQRIKREEMPPLPYPETENRNYLLLKSLRF